MNDSNDSSIFPKVRLRKHSKKTPDRTRWSTGSGIQTSDMEGRERLMALAENKASISASKSINNHLVLRNNNAVTNGGASHGILSSHNEDHGRGYNLNQSQPIVSQPGTPSQRIYEKSDRSDFKRRDAFCKPVGGIYNSSSANAIYAVSNVQGNEKSLPDRLSDALKGLASSKRHSATYLLGDSTTTGSAPSASSNQSASSSISPSLSHQNEDIYSNISKSVDKLTMDFTDGKLSVAKSLFRGRPLRLQDSNPPPIPPKFPHDLNSFDDLKTFYKHFPSDAFTPTDDVAAEDIQLSHYETVHDPQNVDRNNALSMRCVPDNRLHNAHQDEPVSPIYANADEINILPALPANNFPLQPRNQNREPPATRVQRRGITSSQTPLCDKKSIEMRRTAFSPSRSSGDPANQRAAALESRTCCSPTDSGYRSVPRNVLNEMAINGAVPSGSWLKLPSSEETVYSNDSAYASNSPPGQIYDPQYDGSSPSNVSPHSGNHPAVSRVAEGWQGMSEHGRNNGIRGSEAPHAPSPAGSYGSSGNVSGPNYQNSKNSRPSGNPKMGASVVNRSNFITEISNHDQQNGGATPRYAGEAMKDDNENILQRELNELQLYSKPIGGSSPKDRGHSKRRAELQNKSIIAPSQSGPQGELLLDVNNSFEDTGATPSPFSDSFSSGPSMSSRSSNGLIAQPKRQANQKRTTTPQANGIGPHGSYDTINTNMSLPDEFALDRCPKLVELDRVPWDEKDIVTVLQRGRTKDLVNYIAIDVVPRLKYLLHRPLVRIAREAQRLSQRLAKCTRHDIHYATKIVLAGSVGEACLKAGMQAGAMFLMSGESSKQSKSQRAGVRFSVGKFYRWMTDAQVSLVINEQATIFLTGVMECLLEEIVLQSRAVAKLDVPSPPEMLTAESLEVALSNNAELWGLLQPYQHLICSRTSSGNLILPTSGSIGSISSGSGNGIVSSTQQQQQLPNNQQRSSRKHDKLKTNGSIVKNLDQILLSTCVGSMNELNDLISRILHYQNKTGITAAQNSCLAACGLLPPSGKSPLSWSRESLQSLFYFMRCSQLEHSENPSVGPPFIVLSHERPYLMLPPLVEWLRISSTQCEHRCGAIVDSTDVVQAARILLPGIDCPARSLCFDDSTSVMNCRESPQTSSLKLKQELGFKLLTSGRSEFVPHALSLLGALKLNTFNDQGLTPLMIACINGDESTARCILDSGANVNAVVPSSGMPHAPCHNLLADVAGWTALTFACAQRQTHLVQYLLDHGASVELSVMSTETPLQIAASMGHHELVSLLLSRGADSFYSTIAVDGFRQKGTAAPVVLAAAQGHRTVLHLLLIKKNRPKGDEVLSLEDFLAEGSNQEGRSKSLTENNKNNTLLAESAGKLSKFQQKCLLEAMYQAAENGYVDITMDLRNSGIHWNAHIWTQTLAAAHELKRKALVQLLLTDFPISNSADDFNAEFIDECLPLLFDIFRQSKNDVTSKQLADILSKLYGSEPIPKIIVQGASNTPRIDAKYVNNPELSDIQFQVEGKTFYGHRIVLFNSSDKFKELVDTVHSHGPLASQETIIIDDVRFDIFKLVMEFLYNGKPSDKNISLSDSVELLAAAKKFCLTDLRTVCESRIVQYISVASCLEIYRHAISNDANQLVEYCEAFFLQNLPNILLNVDGFKKLIYSNRHLNAMHDSVIGLSTVLSERMRSRLRR